MYGSRRLNQQRLQRFAAWMPTAWPGTAMATA
jgi:hypothetical protein